jgi:hypothetical protein
MKDGATGGKQGVSLVASGLGRIIAVGIIDGGLGSIGFVIRLIGTGGNFIGSIFGLSFGITGILGDNLTWYHLNACRSFDILLDSPLDIPPDIPLDIPVDSPDSRLYNVSNLFPHYPTHYHHNHSCFPLDHTPPFASVHLLLRTPVTLA